MILILHIIVAIASLVHATYAYLFPSQKKLHFAYLLVGMTLASGVYLVWQAPTHMLEVCTTGLIYLAIMSVALIATRVKLTRLLQLKNKFEIS